MKILTNKIYLFQKIFCIDNIKNSIKYQEIIYSINSTNIDVK